MLVDESWEETRQLDQWRGRRTLCQLSSDAHRKHDIAVTAERYCLN